MKRAEDIGQYDGLDTVSSTGRGSKYDLLCGYWELNSEPGACQEGATLLSCIPGARTRFTLSQDSAGLTVELYIF